MEDYQTWRELLAALLEKPREQARLAKALGVSALTLQRWARHEASPLPQQRQRLLEALPRHSMLLRALFAEESGDFTLEPEVPTNLLEFAARIFAIHASVPEESRYWSLCTAILSEAANQLDACHLGLSLSVIQCIAPLQGGNVRYLREGASLGTPPWPRQIEFRTRFLGAESLAGRAVATALPQTIADCQQEAPGTGHLPANSRSAIALPVLHAGRIAGCLFAASTQVDYFASAVRAELLLSYSALLKLAFSPEDFYPPEQILLQQMPTLQIQRPYLSSFQQRLLATLKTAFTVSHSLNYREAQEYVWGQIAEELLQLQAPPM